MITQSPDTSIAYRAGVVIDHIGRFACVLLLAKAVRAAYVTHTLELSAFEVLIAVAIVYAPFRVVRYVLSGD